MYMIFSDIRGEAAGAVCSALDGGEYIERLTRRIEREYGKSAVALNSTDAAIHTALHLLGVRDGDYVVVPTLTFYSYVATVDHAGGVPVFVDSDPHTRCVSASALETALEWADLQNKLPRAVVVDNAFGAVADYDVLVPLCKAWGVGVIELATDALGGNYKGRLCGANGDYGVLGMNKRIHGDGALLLCEGDKVGAEEFSRLRYSDGENHDYGMNNITAALDYAQLDYVQKLTVAGRRTVEHIRSRTENVLPPTAGDAGAYVWCKAAKHMRELEAAGYAVKKPPLVHTLPQYSGASFFEHEQGFCASAQLDDYVLVGTNMSARSRKRLARLVNSY